MNPLTVTHKARSNFAGQHLAAAKYFQSQVIEIERVGQPSPEKFAPPEYLHFWFASVLFSVMALEANVYDLMTAADRRESGPLGTRRFRAKDFKKPLFERYNLLYQIVMNGEKLPLDKGLGQEARHLEILRNEIVHYKTEWRSVATVSKRLESMLSSRFLIIHFVAEECFSLRSA